MALPPLITGPRVLCYLNGRLTGLVRTFEHQSATPCHEIPGLDQLDPFELAPTTTSVSGTIGLYRVAGLGGVEGLGMTAQYEALSRQRYATIALVDRLTGALLFNAGQCMMELQRWEVSPKQYMVGVFNFRAVTWANEWTVNTHAA